MSPTMDRIRGVSGDPIFFEIIENSVKEDILEEGLRLDGPHVLDWRYPGKMKPTTEDVKQQLAAPVENGMVKIAILRNPPKDVLEAAVNASGEHLRVIYEDDRPKVAMKSVVMDDLLQEGKIANAGYLQSPEDPRFPKIIEGLCELYSLDVPIDIASQIASRVGRISVQAKNYLNMIRIRNEMVKAQTLAGEGNQVSADDVKALLPPLEPSTWDLVDAVFNRDLTRCMELVSGLQEEECETTIYGITDEFVLLGRIADAKTRFSVAEDIVRDLSEPHASYGFKETETKAETSKVHKFRVQKGLGRLWNWKKSLSEAIKACEEVVVSTRVNRGEARYQLCKLCYDLCQLER